MSGLRDLAAQATPGPWMIKDGQAAVYDTDERRPICSTWDVGDDGKRMYGANRSLIALAPELAVLCADMADALAYVDDWRDRVGIESPESLLARFARLTASQSPNPPSGG